MTIDTKLSTGERLDHYVTATPTERNAYANAVQTDRKPLYQRLADAAPAGTASISENRPPKNFINVMPVGRVSIGG